MAKVSIKAIGNPLVLGNTGITLQVENANDGERSGKIRIGRARVTWIPRGARKGPFPARELDDVIDFLRKG